MLDRTCLAPHALARWAEEAPDRVASQHVDGTRRTFAELHDGTLRYAAALAAVGVEAGDHVGTLLANGFEPQQAMAALGWLRAVEVPLNTALTGRLLEYALGHADVTTLVIGSAFLDRLAPLVGSLPTLRRVVVVGVPPAEPLGVPTILLDDVLAGVGPARDLAGPEYSDLAAILFTSGTTGPSKGVLAPWALIYQFWSWVPDDMAAPGEGLFCPLPLFHNSGRSGFNIAMARGLRFVFRDRFSATHFWDDIRATGCVAASLVGPLTALLHSAPPRPDDADNPLRAVILGPMIPEQEDFERRFGVRAATCYGQTEIGGAVTTGWDHGPWQCCGRERPDYPWPEVRVVNELDEPLGPGQAGELVVRSREPWSMNVGYYKMPEQTVAAWRNGWFHTGDVCRYDEDGWYYFVDRLRDSIRRRGENISSFEVENVVLEHPAVVDCAAVGVRTVHGDDEVLVALVVHDRTTFDPAELLAWLEPRMPRYMLPRYVDVRDDLPRNETTGRVRKDVLRTAVPTPTTWDRDAG